MSFDHEIAVALNCPHQREGIIRDLRDAYFGLTIHDSGRPGNRKVFTDSDIFVHFRKANRLYDPEEEDEIDASGYVDSATVSVPIDSEIARKAHRIAEGNYDSCSEHVRLVSADKSPAVEALRQIVLQQIVDYCTTDALECLALNEQGVMRAIMEVDIG